MNVKIKYTFIFITSRHFHTRSAINYHKHNRGRSHVKKSPLCPLLNYNGILPLIYETVTIFTESFRGFIQCV